MSDRRLIVLKFGGSVLKDEDSLQFAVQEIQRWRRDDWRVVAVVSALAGETDALLEQSRRICPDGNPLSQAAIVANGEIAKLTDDLVHKYLTV